MSSSPVQSDSAKLKVALVVGVSHSGTTMLDLTLGAHPNIVGAGEIYNFGRRFLRDVQRGLRKPCLCGADVSECELWGSVVEHARQYSTSEEAIERTYEVLIERFRERWPNDVLLDSSKKLQSIDLLGALPDIEMRVLFVVRDVRGWVASARDRHPRRARRRAQTTVDRSLWSRGRRVLAASRAKSPVVLARKWRKLNDEYLDGLDQRGVSYMVVSYERLCFETDTVLTQITDFLGVQSVTTLSPAQSGSHVVNGNLVRLDPDRRSRLSYDTRWMRRLDAQLPYLALPKVRRLNDRLVWDDRR